MLDWILVTIFLVCAFLGIGLTFYLGRHHVREIDRIVYGFDIPSDSIFFKIQRVPTYGGAFAWRWGAKRSGLEKIRDKFDKKFQIPFIITFWLFVIGAFSMIAGVIVSKFVLH